MQSAPLGVERRIARPAGYDLLVSAVVSRIVTTTTYGGIPWRLRVARPPAR